MKRILLFLVVGVLLLVLTAPAASAFGWKDVVKMHEAGIADSLILQKIEYSGKTFHLNAEEMEALKEAGVSDAVISAMLRTEAEEDGRYDEGYGYYGSYYDDYGHPYYYPRRRLYVGFGLGVYGPYPWEYDPYWYPLYGRYGRYGHYGRVYHGYRRSYYGHRRYSDYYPRYGRQGRPGPEPTRYRSRVERRIDTHNRSTTRYRSRPNMGTPRVVTPPTRTRTSGPSPTRVRSR